MVATTVVLIASSPQQLLVYQHETQPLADSHPERCPGCPRRLAAADPSGLQLPAVDKARYEKQVEQWNETHPDDQLAINKSGTAHRKPKSKVDVAKKGQRDKERALKKAVATARCVHQ
jgi:hypothetical protein